MASSDPSMILFIIKSERPVYAIVRRFVACSLLDAKRRLSLSATNASSSMESEFRLTFSDDATCFIGLWTSTERVFDLRMGDRIASTSTIISGSSSVARSSTAGSSTAGSSSIRR